MTFTCAFNIKGVRQQIIPHHCWGDIWKNRALTQKLLGKVEMLCQLFKVSYLGIRQLLKELFRVKGEDTSM